MYYKTLIKKTLFATAIMFCFMNILCEKQDDVMGINCDFVVTVDATKYNALETASFEFINAEILEDCLVIKIGASGCSGDRWGFDLVDSGAIAESSPEQRFLKFQLINDEACLAYFERTISFDLTPLQVSGSNEIILNIEGLEASLNYNY